MYVRASWLLAGALAVLACGESTPATPPSLPHGHVLLAISIEPSSPTIAVGDSVRFRATAIGETTPGFVWSVDRPDLVTVDTLGEAHGLKAGNVVIRACASSQGSVCGAVTLRVQ